MPVYLGLDLSTQSLSALAIDTDARAVVLDRSLRFGDALPQYESPDGFLPDADPHVRHADPRMWADALPLLLDDIAREGGFDLRRVAGIGVSGQQHGSVYLRRPFPLHGTLAAALARPTAPIWMDSSTGPQCREIARAVGGDEEVVRITGSRATERFTGPQIRRFAQRDPARYQATKRIHLVSSFLTSLLCDADAPIDRGDGAGMNLLDLQTGDWSETMLEATAPKLRAKLPPVVASDTVVGRVSPRLPFAAGTPVIAGSGDNPCSLVGMGATAPGTAVISLGTSDTYLAAAPAPVVDPAGFGHTFGNPAGGFMGLIVMQNGSLARDEVRRRCGLDWDGFARAILEKTRPGNDGAMLLPYFVPEITPRIPDPGGPALYGDEEFTGWRRPAAAARAVVEGQALALREHTAWLGARPKEILVTGGASRNPGILRVLADVLGARLRRLQQSNAAALGAAMRAAHAAGAHAWEDLFAAFAAPDPADDVAPDPAATAVYDELAPLFAARLRERYELG